MSESKFKVGDKVFSFQYGWGIVIKSGSSVLVLYDDKQISGNMSYYCDGRFFSAHDFAPSLLTVEEAAKLGYFPPKKKVKKKLYAFLKLNDPLHPEFEKYNVIFSPTDEDIDYPVQDPKAGPLILKFANRKAIRAPHLDTEIEVEEE